MPCEETLRGLTSRQGQLFCLRRGAQVLLTPVGHIARSVIGWVIGDRRSVIGRDHSHATYDRTTHTQSGGELLDRNDNTLYPRLLLSWHRLVACFVRIGRNGVTQVRATSFVSESHKLTLM